MRADSTLARRAGAAPPSANAAAAASGSGPAWRGYKRALIGLLFLLVAGLLLNHAREVDWHAVWVVVRGYAASTLLAAAGLAAASYALYGCYDLIGRRHVGHSLRALRVLATAFVSYAFNLNLGALVGGVAVRYRLYSRQGLAAHTITQVVALSMLTNWLGYLVLAGMVCVVFTPALPPGWPLGAGALRGLGLLLWALAGAYLLSCRVARGKAWRWRGRESSLPSASLALLQLALASANWLLIAAIVALLLGGSVDYPTVLGVLLMAAVAGVVTHVPAGLGVLEAVFIALLSHRVPAAQLLGALLAYRAVYYLAPLGLALGIYLWLEAQAKRAGATAESAGAPCSPPGA